MNTRFDQIMGISKEEPKVGSYSPWGTIDQCRVVAEGIVFVSTPSHGGFWLSPERLTEILEISHELRKRFGEYPGCWYEEDCESSKVVFAFPDLFPPEHVAVAEKTCRSHYSIDVDSIISKRS